MSLTTYEDPQGVPYLYFNHKGFWIVGASNTSNTSEIKNIETLEHVVIPKYIHNIPVREIGRSAFRKCYYLKTVDIKADITQINMHAFYECSNLTSINIPSTCVFLGLAAISCIITQERNGLDHQETAPGTLAVKFEPNATIQTIGTYGIERKDVIIITYCGYHSPNISTDGLFYETTYSVVFSPTKIEWGNYTSIVDPSICLLLQSAKSPSCKTFFFRMNSCLLYQVIYIFLLYK